MTKFIDSFDVLYNIPRSCCESLYAKLGFKPMKLKRDKKTLIGTVNIGNTGKLKVYCTSCPAMFFEFKFKCKYSKVIVFETGSGCFCQYWKILEPFLYEIEKNMIEIKG